MKNRFLRVQSTMNLRIQRHDFNETVCTRAYAWVLQFFLVRFFALEHALELKLLSLVFLELGKPAGLTSDLLATGVLNGFPILLVETFETPVTCDVLELFHAVTR